MKFYEAKKLSKNVAIFLIYILAKRPFKIAYAKVQARRAVLELKKKR